jgi:hypothetical protein
MVTCHVCTGHFKESKDSVVLCNHHKGPVHLGCCTDNCSGDGEPCGHSHGVYHKG